MVEVVDLESLMGKYVDVDTLVEEVLPKLGYEASYMTIASNGNGYFAIVKAEKNGETIYLGVNSLETGEPICVGQIETPIAELNAKLEEAIKELNYARHNVDDCPDPNHDFGERVHMGELEHVDMHVDSAIGLLEQAKKLIGI